MSQPRRQDTATYSSWSLKIGPLTTGNHIKQFEGKLKYKWTTIFPFKISAYNKFTIITATQSSIYR